jgi:hypothetical protein
MRVNDSRLLGPRVPSDPALVGSSAQRPCKEVYHNVTIVDPSPPPAAPMVEAPPNKGDQTVIKVKTIELLSNEFTI